MNFYFHIRHIINIVYLNFITFDIFQHKNNISKKIIKCCLYLNCPNFLTKLIKLLANKKNIQVYIIKNGTVKNFIIIKIERYQNIKNLHI